MAVDLPADERTLQAAILAAALVADPTTAATIEKLIEIEKLSAQPDLVIVSDDGSGSQPLVPTIDHAVVDHTPIEAAATAEPSAAATHIDTPPVLTDELALSHDVLPATFLKTITKSQTPSSTSPPMKMRPTNSWFAQSAWQILYL